MSNEKIITDTCKPINPPTITNFICMSALPGLLNFININYLKLLKYKVVGNEMNMALNKFYHYFSQLIQDLEQHILSLRTILIH